MTSDPTQRASEGVGITGPDTSAEGSRILAVVRPAAEMARRFTGFFGALAGASMSAAAIVWLALFIPFGPVAVWKIVLAVVSLVLLLAPGGLLLLFWFGLKQLMRLPDQLRSSAGQLAASGKNVLASGTPGTANDKRMGRLILLLRSLVDVRSVLLDSREMLVQAVVLVRMANPISIIVVIGSTVLSGLLIVVALLAVAILAF